MLLLYVFTIEWIAVVLMNDKANKIGLSGRGGLLQMPERDLDKVNPRDPNRITVMARIPDTFISTCLTSRY